MTEPDDWRRQEHRYFGRDPGTDDLLDRHLNRTGARVAAQHDPTASFQVSLLREFLHLLHSALDDEHIDPEVSRRVIERVIYAGTPSPAMVEQMVTMQNRLTEALAMKPLDARYSPRGRFQ